MPPARAKSCVECRQQKARCDRLVRSPLPCTRCFRLGVQCEYKTQFTRALARKLSAGQREKQQQHQQDSTSQHSSYTEARDFESHETPHRPGSHGQDAVISNDSVQPVRSYSSHDESQEPIARRRNIELHTPLHDSTQMRDSEEGSPLQMFDGPDQLVDDILITTADINDKFQYFFTNMHPHFPFLLQPFSISATFKKSPLLFWTIFTIASSFKDKATYGRLQPFVRSLVARILYPTGHSVETCQALCLLCLWPFEAAEPNDDPYFLYAGLATHLALHTGLHRPEFSHEFKRINESAMYYSQEPNEKWATWCACKFVEHQLASKSGVPSGTRDDWAFRKKLNQSETTGGNDLPRLIKQHLLLDILRDKFLCAIGFEGPSLSGLTPPETRMTLLNLFSMELKNFSEAHEPLERLSSVLLHATHVTVAGFCLAIDFAELFRKERLLLIEQGIASATAILDLVVPMAWETLPVHILRAILHTGVFAVQLRRMPDLAIPGMQLEVVVDRAIAMLRTLAYGNDFATRGKIILEAHRSRFDEESDPGQDGTSSGLERGVAFKARMGSNIYWHLVESEKQRHNWNQDAQNIFWELVQSEVNN